MAQLRMTKKRLAILLSKVPVFEAPKVKLEQYPTDSEVASDVLWRAHELGDIQGKVCADLGCGTGILGIGLLFMGAKEVYFVEVDGVALQQTRRQVEMFQSEGIRDLGRAHFLQADVQDMKIQVDLAVQNPPFGVKVRHQDRKFLTKSFEIAEKAYTLAKSESEEFINRFSAQHGFSATHVWRYQFPLKKSMAHHKSRIIRTKVSCLRLVRSH